MEARKTRRVAGGIDEATAPLAVDAGANVLVAGSSIFSANNNVRDAMDGVRYAVTH